MKRKDFEKLRMMRQELDTIEERLAKVPRKEYVGDTYGDYRTGHKKVKVIHGTSSKRHNDLVKRYQQIAEQLKEKIHDTEDELEQIDDPVIRDIFRLYYQDGLSEEEVADRKGYSRPRISQLINDFWGKTKD